MDVGKRLLCYLCRVKYLDKTDRRLGCILNMHLLLVHPFFGMHLPEIKKMEFRCLGPISVKIIN